MSKSSVAVLFVCLGNICRSPTAHGVFQHKVEQAGLAQNIAVDSCGTGAWHAGESPDAHATQAASVRGYDLSSQRARQLQAEDFAQFDYILVMDGNNLSDINALKPAAHQGVVDLMLRYSTLASSASTEAQTSHQDFDVPDPYYGGVNGFDQVLDMIEQASVSLLEAIRQQHSL